MTNIGPCAECGKPIGPLDHPGEQIRSGAKSGQWRHKPPCPTPARATGQHPFPYLGLTEPTPTSTGGKPHKQHQDDNVNLPPKRPGR